MNNPFTGGKTNTNPPCAEPIDSELIALEERIMFDGAAAADVADAVTPDTAEAADPQADADALVAAAGEMPQFARNEIFFVDAAVEHPASLIAELPSGAEVVVLESGQDGVVQMAFVLEGRTGLDTIHILAHGKEGQLSLGGTALNADSILGAHEADLGTIGEALGADGDILIYGCAFTAGEVGQETAELLAGITGADIAASDDLTGHADRGGDWVLETEVGQIEGQEIEAGGWDGVLAPPEVTVPESALATSEDTDLVINGLSVADADGDNLDVSLDVSNGTITLAQTTGLTVSGNGTGSVTLSGSAADVNNALAGMTYRSESNFNGSDTLAVAVDDGSTVVSESLGIQVAAVNDAPTLTPTNPSVDERGTTTLTDANFGVDDPDLDIALNTNPQLAKQLVFKLDPGNLPDEGNLLLNGAPLLGGSTFSLQDVQNGSLTYRHGGADVSSGDTDDFAVTINDGGGSGDVGPSQITIDLQPVNQGPAIGGSPSVFEGEGTEDEFGSPGTVTEAADIGASLAITDRDDAPADSQITITNIDNAGEGTLFWDADGDGRLDAGEALNGGETFAADELAAGRLRFAHSGNEVDATNPSFDIEVTDGGGGGGSGNAQSSGPQTIDIAVDPNDDNPELTTNSAITVTATGPQNVTLDNTNLQVTDPDTGSGLVVYVVTEVPTKGELRFNGDVLGVGARFSQADIDAGRINYNSTAAFNSGETDTFRFEVRDSTLRAFNTSGLEGADRDPNGTITEHTFTINLEGDRLTGTPPGDPAPGRSGMVEIETSTITGLTVTEDDGVPGGDDTILITSSELEINLQTLDGNGGSVAISPEETLFRITSAPGNGTLFLAGTAIGNFDTFTQADINTGDLTFVHDGSENHQDSFAFSVSGGTSAEFSNSFALNAIPTNDAPTVVGNDLPLLPEGASVRVTTSFIGLGDVDSNNEPGEGGGANDPNDEATTDDLMFRVTDLPDNGTLERFDGSNWVTVTTDDLLPSDLLTASADGETSGLRYTHDGSENHSDSFSFEVRDDLTSPGTFNALSQAGEGAAAAGNISGTDTVNVTLAPQNDAPISPEDESGSDSTITDEDGNSQTTANILLNLPEGGTGIIDDSLLNSVDTDNTDLATLQYRLTQAPAYGVLTVSGNQLGVGSTFTQEDISNGRLNYEHDGSESFADDFKFIVSDSVNDHVFSPGGSGGESTFNIIIDSARNDPPEIENGGAGTIDLFGTFSHDFGTDLAIADPDIDDGNVNGGAGETDFVQVTVTLKDSSGSNVDLSTSGGITLGSTTGLTQTDADDDDGDLVFQGTFAAVQAALNNLEVALPNQDFNDTFTLDVTVDDRLRDASGNLTAGANGDIAATTNEDGTPVNDSNNRDTVSITFRASDDNDDPTITSAPGDQSVNEDAVLDLSGYVVDDVDAFDSPLSVDLAVSNGHLSVSGNATTSSPSSLTLTGTLSEINAALANLTYIANLDFHSRDGSTSNLDDDDTLTVTINDGGANGTGGGTDVSVTSTNIAVNPVNDAPTVSLPGTQTLASGIAITFSGPDAPTVGDAKDAANTPFNDVQRLTVSVPSGAGTLTGSGTSGLPDLNGSDETLAFEGTLAQLNSELNGLRFTPSDPNADVTIPVTVELNDQANGGTGLTDGVGGALTTSDTFNVQISGTNDGPSVTFPSAQTVDEDNSLTFSSGNGNVFIVSDPDDFGTVMESTVSVDHGVVTAASGSGATLSGDGTATVTIRGTESEINAALDGLVYTPAGDFHTAGVSGDTITVTINDEGNTGTGGALSRTETVEITVDPVNDRPTAVGGPETIAVVGEDQTGAGSVLSSLLSSNYADSTDNQTPTGGDSSTPLSFVAITGSTDYDLAQGTWQVADGSGGWIDVPASGLDVNNALVVEASRAIRFTPAADFHGTPGTLDVRLADGDTIDAISASSGAGDIKDLSTEGGTDQTGRWSAGTVTIQTSVSNENDPPSGSDATLAAIDEDNTTSSGNTVGILFTSVFDDATDDQTGITGGADASTSLGGIAVVGSAADAVNEGTWQYSTDDGSNWTDIPQGANDNTNAILLPNDARLRLVPVADFNGTPGALVVQLADATQTFSASADISGVVGDDPARGTDIWSSPVNLNTTVTPVNDVPSASPSQDFMIGEDDGTQTVNGFMQSVEEGGGADEDSQTVTFSVEGVSDGTNLTAAELFETLPTFTDATDGDNTLTFTASDALATGETETVTVTVGVTDNGGTSNGGSDTGADQTFTITIAGTNDAPLTTGLGDEAGTDGETVSVDVSGSFSDVDATDSLRFSATGLPPGLMIDPVSGEISGQIDFDGSTGGPYSVTVTATDFDDDGNPTGTSADASFTWTVNNLPPVAVDDTDTTDEDAAISRDAAAGVITPNDQDTGPDGDTLVVDQVDGAAGNVGNAVAGSAGGEFTINADGSYDFDPDGDFDDLAVGESRMTETSYRVSDGEGGFDTATLTLIVTGVNDPPVGVNDTIPVTEDTPVSQNVLGNDTDVENDGLTIKAAEIDTDGDGSLDALAVGVPTSLTDAAGDPIGTITVEADGTVSFTPAPNYTGPVPDLTYTPNDGTVDGSPATVTIGPIVPVDDPLSITGLTDGTVAGTDGSVLESDLADGTNAAGPGETLAGSFTISVADGVDSLSVGGTVISEAQLLAATPGAPVNVSTALGTLAITGFDPDTGVVGYAYTLSGDVDHSGGPVSEDIALELTDGDGDTVSGTLAVAVIDDAPVANADTDEAVNSSGNPSSVAAGNVVTGSEPGGDPNTLDGVADAVGADAVAVPVTGVVAGTGTPLPGNLGSGLPGSFGTLTLNGDGSYSYVPDYANMTVAGLTAGTSVTDVFTYQIADADGDTATATLSISVVGTPAVLGLGDGAVPGTDGAVLESDLPDGTDAGGGGDVLAGSFTLAAPNGVATLEVGGTVIDETTLLATGTTPVTLTTPLGTLEINGYDAATGTVSYSYTLADDTDHSGGAITDDFVVTLTDDLDDASSGTLSIAIENDAPVAVDDTASLGEDDSAPVTGNVVTGNDALGADETASPVTGVVAGTGMPSGGVGSGVAGSFGTLTLNADGSYSYLLDTANPVVQGLQAGESLNEVFTYEITDGDGDSATATLTLTIAGANDAPVADPDAATTDEDRPVSGNVLTNDSDPDGDPLLVTAATVDIDGDGLDDALTLGAPTLLTTDLGDPIGTLTLGSDGAFTFTPAPDYDGPVPQVSYTVSDGQGGTVASTLDIAITPVNDPPVGVADTIAVTEDTPVSQNVLGNDTDVENDGLTITAAEIDTDGDGSLDALAVGVPTSLTDAAGNPIGTITVEADGTVSFTPAPNYTGPVPDLTYTPNDGTVDGSPATVTIGPIVPVDDPLSITGLTDGTVAGTDGSVLESDLSDGTNAAGPGETLAGSFTITVADGVDSLSVGGTVISEAQLLAATPGAPVNLSTALGTLAITGFDPDTGVVGYAYTLSGDVDHSGGPVSEDIALELTDGDGDTVSGTLAVAVIDDAPVANADTDEAVNSSGNPSSVAAGNVVTGSEPGGDPNTLDGVADAVGADAVAVPVTGVVAGTGTPLPGNLGSGLPGSFGTLTLNGDGSYSYVPDYANMTVAGLTAGTSVTDVFTYQIADADGDTATATLSISVVGTPAVLGLGDGAVPGTDGAVLESDLPGGTDAGGGGDVLAGSFTLAAPNGVKTLEVGGTVIDETTLLATGTTPVTLTTPLGTLEINGYDAATGTVSYSYTLADDTDHSGGAITDDFVVTLTDDLDDASSGTLSIVIEDDAPVAVDDMASLGEDDSAPVTGNVFTGNDALGADETASPVTGVVAGTGTPVPGNVGSGLTGSFGTLTLNADGSYSYLLDTANPVVQGLQAGESLTEVFTYEITDGDGDSATATLTLTIAGANDAPVADPDAATTDEDRPVSGNVLTNDSDPDGDPLLVIAATVDIDGDGLDDALTIGAPTLLATDLGDPIGTLTLGSDGAFTFTPAPDYNGPVPQVSYTVSDGHGGTVVSTLDLAITPVNDPPVGVADTIPVTEDTPVSQNVLGNDTDVEDDGLTITAAEIDTDGDGSRDALAVGVPASLTDAAGDPIGTITVEADGTVSFTPAPNYTGPVPDLTYTPNDGTTDGIPATISFGPIISANDPPVANPDVATSLQQIPISGNVLANDTDIENDSLSVESATVDIDGDGVPDPLPLGTPTALFDAGGAPIGSLTLNPDGSFDFDPDSAFSGSIPQVAYVANDGNGGTASSTLDIEVTPVNPPPGNERELFELVDDDDRPRPPFIVDPIVDETVNAVDDLFGTQPLLSGVNTALGVPHPILAAINSLQSLDGTATLSTSGPNVFGGLAADPPVTEAVRNVGFDLLDEQHRIYNRDFPNSLHSDRSDRIGEPVFGTMLSAPVEIATRLGVLAEFTLARGVADGPEFEMDLSLSGQERVNLVSAHVSPGNGIDFNGSTLHLTGLGYAATLQLDVQLDTGSKLHFAIEMNADGTDFVVTEIADRTFATATEEIAYANETEIVRLMQALKWGAR